MEQEHDLYEICNDDINSTYFGCWGTCINSTCICASDMYMDSTLILMIQDCSQLKIIYDLLLFCEIPIFIACLILWIQCYGKNFGNNYKTVMKICNLCVLGAIVNMTCVVFLYIEKSGKNPLIWWIWLMSYFILMIVAVDLLSLIFLRASLKLTMKHLSSRIKEIENNLRKILIRVFTIQLAGHASIPILSTLVYYNDINIEEYNKNLMVFAIACPTTCFLRVLLVFLKLSTRVIHLCQNVIKENEELQINDLQFKKLIKRMVLIRALIATALVIAIVYFVFMLFSYWKYKSIPLLFILAYVYFVFPTVLFSGIIAFFAFGSRDTKQNKFIQSIKSSMMKMKIVPVTKQNESLNTTIQSEET